MGSQHMCQHYMGSFGGVFSKKKGSRRLKRLQNLDFGQNWAFSICSRELFWPKNLTLVILDCLWLEFSCANKMGPPRALLWGSRGPSSSKMLYSGHNFGLLLGWKLSPVSQNIHFKRSKSVYKGTFCWDFEIRPKKIKKSIKFGSWRVQKWVRPENLTIFFQKKRPEGHKKP